MTPDSAFSEYADSYDDACQQGLRWSGENRDYFARKRVEYVREMVSDPAAVGTIVDFGCGLGDTAPYLWESFPRARVVGLDSADAVIAKAQERFGGERAEFHCGDLPAGRRATLVYCNGVFHHIRPANRPAVVRKIYEWLEPGGMFALWENNPWNPGTRLVMSRIPFDRDAETLSVLTAKSLLRDGGFDVVRASFRFYFPSALKALRPMEGLFEKLPLGAQYCVLARKPRL
jgi:trans-aconitate methyltransferase